MQKILQNKQLIIWGAIFSLLVVYLGYAVTRDMEWALIGCFGGLFILYGLWFIPAIKTRLFENKWSVKQMLLIAIGLRGLLFFTTPNLSDDYFRFVWDGNMIVNGTNPFEYQPNAFVFQDTENHHYLKEKVLEGATKTFPGGMNSKDYYSVYPPFNQLVFTVSSWLAGNDLQLNIYFLRFFILLFEVGALYLFVALLKLFELPEDQVFLYAFNPLVIIELTQNIHFEGVTIFWVLFAVYQLLKNRTLLAGVVYALAVTTKLVPLLFLPLFLLKIPFKKLVVFYTTIGVAVVLLFVPFLGIDLLETFGSSIRLYFKTFEFNASLYYVLREIGYWNVGYNTIHVIGKYTPMVVLGSVLLLIALNIRKKKIVQVFKLIVWALLIYYSLASIVHPWYAIYLLAFAVFTNYRFPIVWSGAIILSYTAYREIGEVNEIPWLVLLEYLLVLVAVIWDLYPKRKLLA
ncbi:MAG: glycosyltransferase 87 family protein [Flavobacteriales bacterium]|jgi:hypothetical protein|nr:glycosyltransferase 87 family protein [Flavobacteriales bacterium]